MTKFNECLVELQVVFTRQMKIENKWKSTNCLEFRELIWLLRFRFLNDSSAVGDSGENICLEGDSDGETDDTRQRGVNIGSLEPWDLLGSVLGSPGISPMFGTSSRPGEAEPTWFSRRLWRLTVRSGGIQFYRFLQFSWLWDLEIFF